MQVVGEEKMKEAEKLSSFKTCPIVWVRGQVSYNIYYNNNITYYIYTYIYTPLTRTSCLQRGVGGNALLPTASRISIILFQLLGGVLEAQQAWFDGTLPKAKYELTLQLAAREMVAHSALTNTLVVLSKKTCPPCTEVKIMLEEAGKPPPVSIPYRP